jgi:hypothetical protein
MCADVNAGSPFDLEYRPDRPVKFEPNTVFVIMSFSRRNGSRMLDIYSAIKDGCAELKLKATRVDENVGSGFIHGEIIESIAKAEFIICDLTHERPNVYYELGYAHGIGNRPRNILLIAKKGTAVHFDIAPFRVQPYRSAEDLRTIIAGTFKEMVREKRKMDKLTLAPASAAPALAPASAVVALAPASGRHHPSNDARASAESPSSSDDHAHDEK